MPYAKHVPTGKEVLIDDVPSGLVCDCICVGCGVQVVARKGDEKIHHFAHKPKASADEVVCPFNAERAVFWMCRKILMESDKFCLPGLTWHWSDRSNFLSQSDDIVQKITEKQEIIFDQVFFPDPLENSYNSDVAILTIGNHRLAITMGFGIIALPSSWELSKPYKHNEEILSHLIVQVENFYKIFKERKKDFRNILQEILLESTDNKTWVYHLREDKLRNSFKEQVDKKLAEVEQLKKARNERIRESVSVYRAAKTQLSHVLNKRREYNAPIKIDRAEIDQRLKELVEQAEKFRVDGYQQACRCENCYFLNEEHADVCSFCSASNFKKVTLNDDYYYAILNKYQCWNYPRNSIINLPKFKNPLPDQD